MSTMPCPAVPLPQVRHWPLRLAETTKARWRAWRRPRALHESDLGVLAELSPKTLRDIGAPDWVQERARGATDPFMQTAGERRPWWWVP